MADRFTVTSTTPGQVATHSGGTLAARPASPAAGDTYAVTTGAQTGARYTCFVTGSWEGTALPTASAAGQVPVSDGAGTAYTATSAGDVLALGMVAVLGGEVAGTTLISDGAGDIATTSADVSTMLAAANDAAILAAIGAVPTSRTVAGAALSGDVSAATLRSAISAPPLAYIGPFSTTAYLGGDTGATAPSFSKGTAVVFQFWKIGPLAGASGALAAHLDSGVTEGWDLGYSSGGNLFVFLKGINSDATIGLVGWNSLANGLHGVAINFVDDGGATGHLQWALDGVAQSDVAANGTYVPPTVSTPLIFGLHPAGTVPALLADLAAVRAYSTALSAGDLLTASTPSLSIPAVTGTVSFDLDCARDFWPGYATCVTGAATAQWTLTVNGGLTRRIHQ